MSRDHGVGGDSTPDRKYSQEQTSERHADLRLVSDSKSPTEGRGLLEPSGDFETLKLHFRGPACCRLHPLPSGASDPDTRCFPGTSKPEHRQ